MIGESYSVDFGHALVVPVAEVLARAGSQVTYADFQRWGPEVVALPQIRSVIGRDARVTLATIGMGSGTTKGGVACTLVEPGGAGELLGLMFTDGRQHFELDTLQEHVAGHTESRLLFKTALEGSSTVIGNGMVGHHCVARLAGVMPSTPGQFGVVEASVGAAIAAFGVPLEQAVAVAFLHHLTHFVSVTLVGGLQLRKQWQPAS